MDFDTYKILGVSDGQGSKKYRKKSRRGRGKRGQQTDREFVQCPHCLEDIFFITKNYEVDRDYHEHCFKCNCAVQVRFVEENGKKVLASAWRE